MKDFYDILNKFKMGNETPEERAKLELELGNLNAYETLDQKIMGAFNEEEKPSEQTKGSLDVLFEQKHSGNTSKQLGIFPITGIKSKNPWKVFAYAASVSLFMYFTVQLGFNGMNDVSTSYPLLADSLDGNVIDSNNFYMDSLVLRN